MSTLTQQEYDERKEFIEKLGVLVKSEYDEVFRIIKKADDQWSENSNGIFFDLTLISDSTFETIREYLKFCMKTRHEHETRLKELETIRIQNEHYVDSDEV
jgi:hypothetical protein